MRTTILRRVGIVAGAAAVALGLLTPASLAAPSVPAPDGSDGSVAPYIVGGDDARARSYMASIQYPNGDHECGGSLISPQWVLTAKHCAGRIVPGEFHVRIGSADRTAGGTLAGIRLVISHPLGGPDVPGNDVALVMLDQAVPHTPIPIARRAGGPGTFTRIYGFGIMCDRDITDLSCAVTSKTLQNLDTKIAPDNRCTVSGPQTGKPFFDRLTEFCTVSRDGQHSQACFGDSGGPQTENRHGREVLIGATSGDGDDWEARPYVCSTSPKGRSGAGIWEDVPAQHDWIVRNLREHDPVAATAVERLSAAA